MKSFLPYFLILCFGFMFQCTLLGQVDLPVKTEEAEIIKVVEEMPRFPGCEHQKNIKAKKSCAQQKMLKYIYSTLEYPKLAKDNGVEGMAVIQFIVQPDGSLSDIKIVKDPGAGCGEAAKKVVESMNTLPEKWTPGKHRGEPVEVKYTLPVKFKL